MATRRDFVYRRIPRGIRVEFPDGLMGFARGRCAVIEASAWREPAETLAALGYVQAIRDVAQLMDSGRLIDGDLLKVLREATEESDACKDGDIPPPDAGR